MKKFLLSLSLMLSFCAFAQENINFNIGEREFSYNPDTLKFYESSITLSSDEVKALFPNYEIVLISKFDKERKYYVKNSIFGTKKVLLLNDDTRTFHNFFVYPISSRNEFQNFKNGEIKSLITVYGKKNVRLKHAGGDEFEIVVK